MEKERTGDASKGFTHCFFYGVEPRSELALENAPALFILETSRCRSIIAV